MRYFLTGFFILCGMFFGYTQHQEDIVLNTGTGKIYGTLSFPASSKNKMVALLIAGSGPTDRDGNNPYMKNNSLKMLSDSLVKHGIAVLRYDKRGVAKSRDSLMKESDLRFETYIRDAEDWIKKLKAGKHFKKVIVVGHSEGSLIGMIAAVNAGADKFISLEGAGRSASDVLKEQLANQPQSIRDMAFPIIDKLVKGDTVGNVPPLLASLFRPSVQPYIISWFRYDPSEAIKKLNIPVLIVQGTTDIQVPVSDAEILHKNLPQSELKIIEGMNHILKPSVADRTENLKTYSNPDLPLHPELIPLLVAFIQK